MNLYIESKDMPTSCEKCNFIKNSYDWFYCGIGEKDGKLLNLENKNDELIYTSSRHPDCPLVEIPTPHGRLIDADVISKLEDKYCEPCCMRDTEVTCSTCVLSDFLEELAETPTIIEARC